MSIRSSFAASLLLFIFSSCNYRWTPQYPYSGDAPTINIGCILGDESGFFTTEVANALASSGLVRLSFEKADFRLQLSVLEEKNETIGFRRDPQKVAGKVQKNLLATEGRKVLTVEATLYKAGTEEIALGPFKLTTEADYDYVDGDSIEDLTFTTSSNALVTVLPFSLGQLEPIGSAREAAAQVLYRRMAKKIVDVISAEW